jgi:Ca2+-binding RTX toxin-like protein
MPITPATISKSIFKDAIPGFSYTVNSQQVTVTHGVTVSSNHDSGVFSAFAVSSLFNHGNIFSGLGDSAVTMTGDISFISNAFDGTIQGAHNGVSMDGITANIVNSGVIRGLDGDGVQFGLHSTATSLNNFGTIFGKHAGVHEVSDFAGGVIVNAGLIASSEQAIFINTLNQFNTVVVNNALATIRGGTAAIEVHLGTISLDNRGVIIGRILIDSAAAFADTVTNRGTIKGAVFFNDGNDVFKGKGGTSGAVHGGNGGDTLIGGSHVDSLFGDLGGDTLNGGGGNDRLHGGFGFDTLSGGGGSDRFFFETALDEFFNLDRITDFTANLDKIVLDDDIFAGLGADGILTAARFHIGAAAADASDRIIYSRNTGFLFFDPDGKGGVGEVHFATLAPHLALHSTDFVVVA